MSHEQPLMRNVTTDLERQLEFICNTPFRDISPAFTLHCALPWIKDARFLAHCCLESVIEEAIRQREPDLLSRDSGAVPKRYQQSGLSPTPISPEILAAAVELALISQEEMEVITLLPPSQLHKEDDISPFLHQMRVEIKLLHRMMSTLVSHQEAATDLELSPTLSRETPKPDITHRSICAILQRRFSGELEREIEGTLGKILIFRLPPNSMPNRIAVKTTDPSRVRSVSHGDAIAKFVHEIKHWVSYRHSPFIVTPFYTEVVHGWPYVVMPYCEYTMRQYIDRSVPNTGYPEALALLVQVICGLEFARQRGLLAHQDLKPENVLLQSLDSRLTQPHDYPFHWRAKLADFGMSNGYMELKVPWGSRPYLAPEQYHKDADLSTVDVFACGVMLHELITGKHPVGETTSDIWPKPKPGKSRKWAHETRWRKWAQSENKAVFSEFEVGNDLRDLMQSCLSTNPVERPSLCSFRESLLDALKRCDPRSYETLLMLLVYYQSTAIHSEAINTESDLQRYQFERID